MEDKKKYCYNYPRPAYTVDIAIFNNENILLIKRKHSPFQGLWALPGGFMDMHETPEDAATRELQEETWLEIKRLSQFKTFGTINRDPRHRTISTVFYSIIDHHITAPKAGDDAAEAQWWPLEHLPDLAFDHQDIIIQLLDFLGTKKGAN